MSVHTALTIKSKNPASVHTALNWASSLGHITEISREVENNNIARLHAYAKQYVSRRNGAAGESFSGGGSSGRS